jgi:hypothetical protein
LEITTLVGRDDQHGVVAQPGRAAAVGRIAVVVSEFGFFQRFLQFFDQLPLLLCPSGDFRQSALVVVYEVIDGATVVVDDAVDGSGLFHPLTPRLHCWTAAGATSLCVIQP